MGTIFRFFTAMLALLLMPLLLPIQLLLTPVMLFSNISLFEGLL